MDHQNVYIKQLLLSAFTNSTEYRVREEEEGADAGRQAAHSSRLSEVTIAAVCNFSTNALTDDY